MAEQLDQQDAKLVVLARAAMARAEAGTGASVRDVDGPSPLPSLAAAQRRLAELSPADFGSFTEHWLASLASSAGFSGMSRGCNCCSIHRSSPFWLTASMSPGRGPKVRRSRACSTFCAGVICAGGAI